MECQCAGCYPERMARKKFRNTMNAIDRIQEELQAVQLKPDSEERIKTLEGLNKLLNVLIKRLLS